MDKKICKYCKKIFYKKDIENLQKEGRINYLDIKKLIERYSIELYRFVEELKENE